MINKVILIGHLTKDCELRYTGTQKAVATFTLAVNRAVESNGQSADFIPCVCWGKVAENVEKYTSKGSHVAVEGRLQQRTYDNKQGQKVYVVEVICNQVEFLSKAKEEKKANDNEFYNKIQEDMNDYDNSYNSFDIMENDIQF